MRLTLVVLIGVATVLATLAPRPVVASDGQLLAACTLAPPPSAQSFILGSAIRPGGAVIIQGTNFFGPVQGQVLIHLTNYLGQPLVLPLQITAWGDTFAAGIIPPAPPAGVPPWESLVPVIYGVESQTATFEIVTWCGQSSTASGPLLSAAFTPFMDIEPLPWFYISCSRTSNHNGDWCQNTGGHNWPSECEWPAVGLAPLGTGPIPANTIGFLAGHNSGWGGGNSGTDTFVAHLINQWSVEAIAGFNYDPMHVDGSYDNSSGMWARLSFSPSPQNNWTVTWRQDACSLLTYSGFVSVMGPIGVPYNWIAP